MALIQAMAKGIVREESIMTRKQRRFWSSCEVNNVLSEKKVTRFYGIQYHEDALARGNGLFDVFGLKESEGKEAYDYLERLFNGFDCTNIQIRNYDGLDLHQKNILLDIACLFVGENMDFVASVLDGSMAKGIVREESIMTGKQRKFWNSCEVNNVLSEKKQHKTTLDNTKVFKKVEIMKLSNCYNLTTTPDFSEITSPAELDLEGFVNLVSVHPSIGMLKRLVLLNLSNCKRLQKFPSRVETRTAITEVPSFVSSLINLESLSIGGQGRIQPRWWTSITAPFGLL
nr:NB-ARC domains-containing protein [Tanacetum cinerariifolium]GEY79378.1 NB-ARC domains-containing protein [Tanacetum cinerariifolium]